MSGSVTGSVSSGDQQRSPASAAQRTEEARAAITASLNSAGSKIDSELQWRAKMLHSNAESLNKQDKNVEKQTKQLSKDGDALEKFLKKHKKKVPETDAFEDEMAKLEADLDMLEDTLREVEGHLDEADTVEDHPQVEEQGVATTSHETPRDPD